MTGGIVIYGDPHGEWRPLLRACAEEPPDGVVLLGDCGLDMPLRQKLAPLFAAGIRVCWIPGNHDTSTEALHDFLWEDYPSGDIHAGRADIGGLTVAGLGGVFKGKIWYPRLEAAEPAVSSRGELLRRTRRGDRWRGGLPLSVRDAIFPEDVQALRGLHADILVTHEAPSVHRHGFVGIDEAARVCRARLIVHGHHHESYEGKLPTGASVRGLGKTELFRIRREDLP